MGNNRSFEGGINMFRRFTLIVTLISCLALSVLIVQAQDPQKSDLAIDYYRHDLPEKAKEVFINILHHAQSSSDAKAEALYWLGQISFEEGRYSVAFEDWEELVKEYPQSSRAKEINERLDQLREIITQASDASVSSVVAKSYIENGDFWSESDRKFSIDSSWIPNVEMAIQWYDRVIVEFPDSNAAEIAFQRKLFTLLGWEGPGRYGESYGIKVDFNKYMPLVLETFTEFEKAFPNSSYLQGFRYQIAQAYWGQKDWDKTREWLQKIIDAGKGEKTFYTETAKARLKKVEF